jgi:hypothetical protein
MPEPVTVIAGFMSCCKEKAGELIINGYIVFINSKG